jgi:Na+-transporting methylmalonyl-CoA/oxaloacetate decarboxylase gamma subunit
MISAEAAKGDLEKLIAEAKTVTVLGEAIVLVLKGILVAVKVGLTCRTNTVKLMDKMGIARDKEEKKIGVATKTTSSVEE